MGRGYSYAPGETTDDLVAQGRIPAGYVPAYSGMPTTNGSASSGGANISPDLLAGVQNNLRSANAGELSPDVQAMLAQHAAELGVGSGTGGSEFNKYRSLRDLGLASIQRQDFATNALLGQFMTPYQQASLYQNYGRNAASDNAAFQARANGGFGPGANTGGIMPTVPAAVLRSPSAVAPVPTMRPAAGGGGDVNALVNDLFTKYGGYGGGGGMAPMGNGTIPGSGVQSPMNAGPLNIGDGNNFQTGLDFQQAAEGGWGEGNPNAYEDWLAYS